MTLILSVHYHTYKGLLIQLVFPLVWPLPHKAGWTLQHKVCRGLLKLIDAVFWPNQACQTSALYKYAC